jgi:hypothetical protein
MGKKYVMSNLGGRSRYQVERQMNQQRVVASLESTSRTPTDLENLCDDSVSIVVLSRAMASQLFFWSTITPVMAFSPVIRSKEKSNACSSYTLLFGGIIFVMS